MTHCLMSLMPDTITRLKLNFPTEKIFKIVEVKWQPKTSDWFKDKWVMVIMQLGKYMQSLLWLVLHYIIFTSEKDLLRIEMVF